MSLARVRILALLASSVATPALAPAQEAASTARDAFAWSMPLAADGGAALYELEVPAGVYQRAVSTGLADLRVLNGRGEVVPYAIGRASPASESLAPVAVPLFPLQGDARGDREALDLSIHAEGAKVELRAPPGGRVRAQVAGVLLDLRKLAAPVEALQLDWPADAADFTQQVQLEASDDLARWTPLAQATLAQLRHEGQVLRQQRIAFAACKPSYLRVLWERGHAPVPVATATVQPAPRVLQRPRQELAAEGVADAQAARRWLVDLGAHLPVDRVDLRLPEPNTVVRATIESRPSANAAWRAVASGTFFRLERAGAAEARNEALVVGPDRDRYWRISVDGAGGGLGHGAPTLVAGYVPEVLRFVARGPAPYELVVGSAVATSAESPWPTLELFDGAGHAIAPAPSSAGAPVEAGGVARLVPPRPPMPWRRWALWAVLVAGVSVLALAAWKLLRELDAAGHG